MDSDSATGTATKESATVPDNYSVWIRVFKAIKTVLLSPFGRVKTPAFQAAASAFFFFTFGNYDAYGNRWSARPSSEIS
jgi:hypothetical protein